MVYKRGKVWWFKFAFNGQQFRESTKQTNKRVAEQVEAARKTELAKGEVGIRDRKPVSTLAFFLDNDFSPVRSRDEGGQTEHGSLLREQRREPCGLLKACGPSA
jgi:hypothetical protein